MKGLQLYVKISKKTCNKIKKGLITCSYFWNIDIPKYVLLLDTHFDEVWCRYMLPNTNTVKFNDIFFICGSHKSGNTFVKMFKNLIKDVHWRKEYKSISWICL